jgi:NADPH-dependent 2,4-dienoyl-CoA reductase/sulfur reductase-like enzyme
MMRRPRVAVIGGGLAGSLASLVLRSRGALPTVFDGGFRNTGGRVGGGAFPDSGAQVSFLVCSFHHRILNRSSSSS